MVMQKKTRKWFFAAGIWFLLFAVFTHLVATVDVHPIGPEGTVVGFSTVNRWAFERIGIHVGWYKITEFLGMAALAVVFSFALLGLYQLVTRKGIRKVNGCLLMLGGFYGALLVAYLVFEHVVINYRPVVGAEGLEPSYPSSHTLLVVCVMTSAAMQIRRLWPEKCWVCQTMDVTAAVIASVTVIGRLLSGVHWLTDILGGLLLSAALVTLYGAGLHFLAERPESRE